MLQTSSSSEYIEKNKSRFEIGKIYVLNPENCNGDKSASLSSGSLIHANATTKLLSTSSKSLFDYCYVFLGTITRNELREKGGINKEKAAYNEGFYGNSNDEYYRFFNINSHIVVSIGDGMIFLLEFLVPID